MEQLKFMPLGLDGPSLPEDHGCFLEEQRVNQIGLQPAGRRGEWRRRSGNSICHGEKKEVRVFRKNIAAPKKGDT